jgi:hypothetical protein
MKYRAFLKIFISLAIPISIVAADPVSVMIMEWTIPTPNSLPHDPALGADGSFWYTGGVKYHWQA